MSERCDLNSNDARRNSGLLDLVGLGRFARYKSFLGTFPAPNLDKVSERCDLNSNGNGGNQNTAYISDLRLPDTRANRITGRLS